MKSNDYKVAAERMKGEACQKGFDICVLVEDFYDEELWRLIIEKVKPELRNKIYFPYPNNRGTRGKDDLKKFKDFVDEKFIICIDSDCEYLYDKDVWYIADYIYHTVVYSKENFQCHHFSLNKICQSLTTKNYDFQSLLEKISKRVAPLFYVWFYFKENPYNDCKDLINNKAFAIVLNFEDSQFNTIRDNNILLQSIEDKVNDILEKLKKLMDNDSWYDSIFTVDIPEIQNRLTEQHSIHPEDILSFCCGHSVLENFIEPFMKKLVTILKNSKIEEVKQALSEDENIKNTISRIENIANQDIKTKLNNSFIYLVYNIQSQQMEEIKRKLAREIN